MKVKLDENLPSEIARLLEARGHDVHTVADEGLTGKDDGPIWDAAAREARRLVTQHLDFSDQRRFGATRHGVVLISIAAVESSPANRAISADIRRLFARGVAWLSCGRFRHEIAREKKCDLIGATGPHRLGSILYRRRSSRIDSALANKLRSLK